MICVLSVTEAAVAAAISSRRSKCRFPNDDDMQKGAATNFVLMSFARKGRGKAMLACTT